MENSSPMFPRIDLKSQDIARIDLEFYISVDISTEPISKMLTDELLEDDMANIEKYSRRKHLHSLAEVVQQHQDSPPQFRILVMYDSTGTIPSGTVPSMYRNPGITQQFLAHRTEVGQIRCDVWFEFANGSFERNKLMNSIPVFEDVGRLFRADLPLPLENGFASDAYPIDEIWSIQGVKKSSEYGKFEHFFKVATTLEGITLQVGFLLDEDSIGPEILDVAISKALGVIGPITGYKEK
ncbi:hypothetical protein BH23CHL3_BH23CHL3_10910 [soil metagenome]